MKFFYAPESKNKFVLYFVSPNLTKQIILHNPEKYTQYTLLHETLSGSMGSRVKNGLINQFYMYICCLLNITKRSRAIFAMEGFWMILVLLAVGQTVRFLSEETTLRNREYTLIH